MNELLKMAKEGMSKARTPYSKFNVGCALKMKDGKYITGGNIENAAYGLCICAERSTMFTAHNLGYNLKNDVEKMCVIGDTERPISPCGSCRQVMSELLPKNLKVVLANTKGDTKEVTVEELLPYGFDESDF